MAIILPELSSEVKKYLLELARNSLNECINTMATSGLEAQKNIPDIAQRNFGCFVTLTKNGWLRGCIGYIEGVEPLYTAVIENACNAGLYDSRFDPVNAEELIDICIEISVLTPPVPVVFNTEQELLQQLVPGEDGIVLEKGYRKSTFLPQVWEQLPDKTAFLAHLSVKAGLPSDGWKTSTIKRYAAIHFKEEKM
jgi:AmmeMemoRadiSam system protein A